MQPKEYRSDALTHLAKRIADESAYRTLLRENGFERGIDFDVD
jgi:hypothetical protein